MDRHAVAGRTGEPPAQAPAGQPDVLPVVRALGELDDLVGRLAGQELFVRHSRGPDHDRDEASTDYESGLPLPGLSVAALDPPSWWTRPRVDWLARQVCSYAQLAEECPDRYPWVLTGRVVGNGPDHEPLVADVEPVARIGRRALDQASEHYHEHFDVGRDSTG